MMDGFKGGAGTLDPPGSGEGVKVGVNPTGASGGSSLPQRKNLSHGVPSWVKAGSVFFVTICCACRDENQLGLPAVADALFEAVRFRQDKVAWYVHLLVLMPDHLHMLVSFPPDKEMKKIIANFKEITAKETDVQWQGDFFDHRLRTDESYEEKAFYVRMNPVRKGLASSLEVWPYVWPSPSAAGPAVPPYL